MNKILTPKEWVNENYPTMDLAVTGEMVIRQFADYLSRERFKLVHTKYGASKIELDWIMRLYDAQFPIDQKADNS